MFGIDDAVFWPMAGSLVSGIFNNNRADVRQEDSQSFNAQQFATRYQTTMKDMQAAGLNPMLAYGGVNGSSPSSSPASSAGMPDLGANYTAAKMANAQIANVAADTENKKAQADLIEAQVGQAKASAWKTMADEENVKTQTAEIIRRLESGHYENQSSMIKATTQELWSRYQYNIEHGMSEAAARQFMVVQAHKIHAETDLLEFDFKAASTLENIGRYSKELKPVVDVLMQLMRRK